MRGFQLWINLPAREKMKPAGYRDIEPSEIPVVALPGGGRVKVIAGTWSVDGQPTPGPIQGLTTDPLYLDVELPAGRDVHATGAADHNAFVYVFEGSGDVGPAGAARTLRHAHAPACCRTGDRGRGDGGPGRARASCCSPAGRCASPSCSTDRS